MAQHGFPMGSHAGNGINPNDLAMSFQNNFSGHNGNGNPFSTSAVFGDDELLEGLAQGEQSALPSHGDYGPMNDISLSYQTPGIYSSGHHGLPMDQPHGNFSSTPDGDPIQSPFSHNFAHQYRSMGHHAFGNPMPYGASPLGDNESRTRLQPGANPKSAAARNSLTPKTGGMAGLSINSEAGFGGRPIGAGAHPHHEKSQQWIQTPNSLGSFPASGFSSPHHASHIASAGMHDIIGRPGAASLPAIPSKIVAPQVSSQEAKKRRRRESHNLVERRRRDNINERIQDLSKLVPSHRLEDEKIRKAIQNGTPLSPSLGGISSPTQATSALAGPGARRAAGATGNITTGLPIEDKDKGPNKGDILNGAVSWTRDLMWMLHLKLQQQEELINALQERGGTIPFEFTDDERRMQSELMETFAKVDEEDPKPLSYSRTAGTGLRVPHHTNYKGEALNGSRSADYLSISPNGHGTPGNEMMDGDQYLEFDDDNDNYLKEEEEFMDTSH